ncbi:MAG: NifX-associated nitrogen fixation protein [Hydrogenothermaceae bacterium]|nr:NifX-associated nitrogen fixation protein [Hydrogenothermaceae bacterium]
MITENTNVDDIISGSEFLRGLVKKLRAYDSYGTWAKFKDSYLLKPFIKTKEEKKKIDIYSDVDKQTLGLVRLFYEAVALVVEEKSGFFVTVAIDITHEGFGKVLIYSGNIILLERTLKDVQKFGFEGIEDIAKEGEKLINNALKNVEKFKQLLN